MAKPEKQSKSPDSHLVQVYCFMSFPKQHQNPVAHLQNKKQVHAYIKFIRIRPLYINVLKTDEMFFQNYNIKMYIVMIIFKI